VKKFQTVLKFIPFLKRGEQNQSKREVFDTCFVILTFPRLNFDYNCNQTGPLYLTVLIKNDAVDNELNIFCYFTYLNIGLNFVFRAEPKKI
jgi:hypothetical protein